MLAAGDMVSRYQAQCLIPAGATDIYWTCENIWLISKLFRLSEWNNIQYGVENVSNWIMSENIKQTAVINITGQRVL